MKLKDFNAKGCHYPAFPYLGGHGIAVARLLARAGIGTPNCALAFTTPWFEAATCGKHCGQRAKLAASAGNETNTAMMATLGSIGSVHGGNGKDAARFHLPFLTFALGRVAGGAAEYLDHCESGTDMDMRIPVSECKALTRPRDWPLPTGAVGPGSPSGVSGTPGAILVRRGSSPP